MKTTRDMSARHEDFVAALFGGRRTLNSGATWRDQGDGRAPRHEDTYAFFWDCKSTKSASTTIKLADLDKLSEQGHGWRVMMPVRFYLDERLTRFRDYALMDVHDAAEVVEQANLLSRIREQGCLDGNHNFYDPQATREIGDHQVGPGLQTSTCQVCGASSYDQPGSEP